MTKTNILGTGILTVLYATKPQIDDFHSKLQLTLENADLSQLPLKKNLNLVKVPDIKKAFTTDRLTVMKFFEMTRGKIGHFKLPKVVWCHLASIYL